MLRKGRGGGGSVVLGSLIAGSAQAPQRGRTRATQRSARQQRYRPEDPDAAGAGCAQGAHQNPTPDGGAWCEDGGLACLPGSTRSNRCTFSVEGMRWSPSVILSKSRSSGIPKPPLSRSGRHRKNLSAPPLTRCFADLPQACLSSGLRRRHCRDLLSGIELKFDGKLRRALTDGRYPLCASLSVAQKTYPSGECFFGLVLLFET